MSSQWDEVYTKKQMAQYPDNALIRFVARNYYNASDRKEVKFLDVGCGAGASLWYLAREGFSVAGLDESIVAIKRVQERLNQEDLDAFLACTDLSKLEFKEDYFDCIVDISSLCYIPADKLERVMSQLYKVLKPGGKLFSISPTAECDKAPFDSPIESVDLKSRFLKLDEIEDMFKEFKTVDLGYCIYGDDHHRIDLWQVQATK